MAVLIEAQGEMLDNIEDQVRVRRLLYKWLRNYNSTITMSLVQVNRAGVFVSSGVNALSKAKILQKNSRKCMCIATIILLIIIAVIVLAVIRP